MSTAMPRKSKIRELTPQPLQCVLGACPAVFEQTETGEILIIGRKYSNQELNHRVGEGEALVAMSREMLVGAIRLLDSK